MHLPFLSQLPPKTQEKCSTTPSTLCMAIIHLLNLSAPEAPKLYHCAIMLDSIVGKKMMRCRDGNSPISDKNQLLQVLARFITMSI